MPDDTAQDRRLSSCRRRNRRMRGLVRTAALLNSSLDLREILQLTLDTATGVMGAEASSVLLVEPETGDLVYETLHCEGDPGVCSAIDEVTRGYRIPPGQGIAGWVARHGRPLNIPDAYEDPRFHKEVDRRTGYRTRSVLAVPLKIDDTVIGVAEVINRKDARAFDREDLVLFHHFCRLAAVAIERAQLHRSRLEKQALDRELAAAREIQAAFLPHALPQVEGYAFGRHYLSAQAVGGDFYDLVSCGGGQLALVIGDVSGKGISAALLGASVASDLRLLLKEGCRPAEVIKEANRITAERSVLGKFVTLAVIMLDLGTGLGRLVSAGHLPPLHYQAATGKARFLEECGGLPMGVLVDTEYEECGVQLRPGDRLVLYTDGIAEAMSASGEFFGLERLKDIIEEHGAAGGTMEGEVLAAVECHTAGSQAHEDDLTYLEVRRLPS